ncbi:2-hydroxyacyl-CoA lyase [Frankliniella fusca]|uniref:2-hydroxyacyl-CoA lyase n=1 Tax=Frankliniella fusca TaxID=407009 RepID=A0AAE1I457_9NEOP|nr:2-hydroxyacyl-CoA lyase [Frankliniella fusca]
MWYTDGVSVFNISNKFSIWPIYLDRVKKENIILAGIWFGKREPKPNTFLKPFHTRMEEFKRDGYLLQRPDGPPVRVRGIVLCGTGDMPAKSLFLRIKQFNGSYGCPRCLHKGESYEGTNH